MTKRNTETKQIASKRRRDSPKVDSTAGLDASILTGPARLLPLEAYLLNASPADIRKVCVGPPALRKLRTYDVVFSNDA